MKSCGKGNNMKIADILKKKMTFSFEVFPPKEKQPIEPLINTLNQLYQFQPDFVSCTYGAGGTNVGRNMEICHEIKKAGMAIPMTHFTCISNTREGIKRELEEYISKGVENVLALRGDIPSGWEDTRGDFQHANQLIAFIKENFPDMGIAAAGAPEKHIQCDTFEEDIAHIRMKQDAGADFIMSQLCYDLEQFERWVEMLRKAGIHLPIVVGVMPVLNKEATLRMTLSMNGCSIPRELAEIISRYYNNPEDFKKAGKEYTIKQIFRYMNLGVNGIHIYSLNKYEDVSEIVQGAGWRKNLDQKVILR